eukprot:TRINITY_DN2175_c0_g1_i1.p1 TRINITY_DN2175_c0_g1~~TRINITY_DN2175_c0_g1_i1.p1  ORF type:complete len:377 (+),score=61.60 TRINITY_DN2175_c0_g1_i1:81-1211(+)
MAGMPSGAAAMQYEAELYAVLQQTMHDLDKAIKRTSALVAATPGASDPVVLDPLQMSSLRGIVAPASQAPAAARLPQPYFYAGYAYPGVSAPMANCELDMMLSRDPRSTAALFDLNCLSNLPTASSLPHLAQSASDLDTHSTRSGESSDKGDLSWASGSTSKDVMGRGHEQSWRSSRTAAAKKAMPAQTPKTVESAVPLSLPLSSLPPPSSEWGETVTIMLRNLSDKYTRASLIQEIDAAGFEGLYDFFYLPIDPKKFTNPGYAFINFIDAESSWKFKCVFEGRQMHFSNAGKRGAVVAATLQGYEANHALYASARVSRGPQECRPLFLRSGQKLAESELQAVGSKPQTKRRPRHGGVKIDNKNNKRDLSTWTGSQ